MPMGRFRDFDHCLAEVGRKHDPAAARRICGAIKRDTEASSTLERDAHRRSVAASLSATEFNTFVEFASDPS